MFCNLRGINRCTALPTDLDNDPSAIPRSHEHTALLHEAYGDRLKTLWEGYGIVSDLIVSSGQELSTSRANDEHSHSPPSFPVQISMSFWRPTSSIKSSKALSRIILCHGSPSILSLPIRPLKRKRFWQILIDGMFLNLEHLYSPSLISSIAAAPSFPGLRRFHEGRGFKQCTGDDSKALMKVEMTHCLCHNLYSLYIGLPPGHCGPRTCTSGPCYQRLFGVLLSGAAISNR